MKTHNPDEQHLDEQDLAMEAAEHLVKTWEKRFFQRELTEEEQMHRKEEWSAFKDAHCAAIEQMMEQGGGLSGGRAPLRTSPTHEVMVISFVSPPKGFLNDAGKQHMLTMLATISAQIREIIEES